MEPRAGQADIGSIDILMIPEVDATIPGLGVKGIGELGNPGVDADAIDDPAKVRPPLSVARLVDDTETVAAHLRQEYGKRGIVLMAHSSGTIIGLKLAQRRPDWFHAYVGPGQSSISGAARRRDMRQRWPLPAPRTTRRRSAT